MNASWDVVILGSGIAGLAAALTAQEVGLRPLVLEKAATIGGGTVSSYGLIWVGQNHLAEDEPDTRDEVVAYLRWLGGGSLDEARMTAFVDHAPEALRFFERSGVRFRLIRGLTDHYYGTAPGARLTGRSIEAELISGHDLGDWRERIGAPEDTPCCKLSPIRALGVLRTPSTGVSSLPPLPNCNAGYRYISTVTSSSDQEAAGNPRQSLVSGSFTQPRGRRDELSPPTGLLVA
jgi:hypothetical protein